MVLVERTPVWATTRATGRPAAAAAPSHAGARVTRRTGTPPPRRAARAASHASPPGADCPRTRGSSGGSRRAGGTRWIRVSCPRFSTPRCTRLCRGRGTTSLIRGGMRRCGLRRGEGTIMATGDCFTTVTPLGPAGTLLLWRTPLTCCPSPCSTPAGSQAGSNRPRGWRPGAERPPPAGFGSAGGRTRCSSCRPPGSLGGGRARWRPRNTSSTCAMMTGPSLPRTPSPSAILNSTLHPFRALPS
mmetsp:Transcript_34779/g.76163  ORF Transcript_34779/g.76163 Transcript_34779/m.76163 type:complete len:244 (-) Transcript_34779:301-1032(-)